MMIVFLVIIAISIWVSVMITKLIAALIELRLTLAIIKKFDELYQKWLRKNPIYREVFSDNPNIDIDRDDEQYSPPDIVANAASHHWSRITRTGGLVSIYMVVCNILIHWGSLSELIIGSIIGIGVSALQGDVYQRLFIQKFAAGAIIPSILLIVIRNYIDTYRIGMMIFSLSSLQLYVTQWLGVLFYYLIQRSLEHHHNPKNIAVLWALVIFIIAIL
jgi:hypothetical protein